MDVEWILHADSVDGVDRARQSFTVEFYLEFDFYAALAITVTHSCFSTIHFVYFPAVAYKDAYIYL